MTSLIFKIKDPSNPDNSRVLEIFFKDWIDRSCDNEVKIVKHYTRDPVYFDNLMYFEAQFTNIEDATAIKLKGIPNEFEKYLELKK